MANQARITTLSAGEYLDAERRAAERSEFHAGEVYAMAGASYAHNLITANFLAALHASLEGGPCVVLPSDMKIRIESSKSFLYPDLSVVCGEPQFFDEHRDVVSNPQVIVEVLSDSTADYDRGGKFELYRSLPSLREYLLVAQDRPYCELHVRQDAESWLLTEYRDLDAVLPLNSVDAEVALSKIYARLSFSGPRPV